MLIVTIPNCNYGKWTYGKCYFRQTFMASVIMAVFFIAKFCLNMNDKKNSNFLPKYRSLIYTLVYTFKLFFNRSASVF